MKGMETARVGASAAADQSSRRLMLGVLCLATFLATGNGTAIAPFLTDIAADLQVDLAAVANLVALMSVMWGVASVSAGTASDRLGRKPILMAGLLILVASLFGVALAGSYGWVAAWRFFGGMGGGAFMGTVFATVSDRFPSAERGRAMGWIITGQSLSLVVGVPLITFVGAYGGWRAAMVFQGVATLLSAAAVWIVVPRASRRQSSETVPLSSFLKLLTPPVVALLGAGTMERVCFAGAVVFLATFLRLSYGISVEAVGVALAIIALGNLVGNVVGGTLSDRLPSRPLLAAASMASTAVVALPMLAWRPGVEVSVLLGLVYSLLNAIGRPALIAALSEVSSGARGALLGLNITFSSFGWLGATALGGWLIAGWGFEALGVLTAATGLLGAVLAAASSWLARRSGER